MYIKKLLSFRACRLLQANFLLCSDVDVLLDVTLVILIILGFSKKQLYALIQWAKSKKQSVGVYF